ncbi:MAG: hypothetical protein M3173_04765, partial [Chloroflexota bacterium]|nr:hypothetical protein [Chloroflexota bacterium]
DRLTQPGEIGSPIDRAVRLATISAHWAIVSDIPVIGSLVVLVRRVIRIALRWYINPIVEQQNAFNDAAVAALHELEIENADLRARIASLERTAKPPAS